MTHIPAATVPNEHAQSAEPAGMVMLREEADEALMIRYQKGEVRAFEVLLTRHRRPVYNFILRYVGSRDRAEDLLQETFLRVIRGAGSYQQRAKFTTWLYTIARNLCVDHSRRQKHRKADSLDQPIKGQAGGNGGDDRQRTLLDATPGKEMGTDRKAINRQLHTSIQRAIATLPEQQREVFLMREFLNLSFKEIGEVVGVPENTVKSRMRYALEKLRLELAEYKDLAKTLA